MVHTCNGLTYNNKGEGFVAKTMSLMDFKNNFEQNNSTTKWIKCNSICAEFRYKQK